MTRKRFIKLLMSKGVERNDANRIAKEFRRGRWSYEIAWIALEWRLEKG